MRSLTNADVEKAIRALSLYDTRDETDIWWGLHRMEQYDLDMGLLYPRIHHLLTEPDGVWYETEIGTWHDDSDFNDDFETALLLQLRNTLREDLKLPVIPDIDAEQWRFKRHPFWDLREVFVERMKSEPNLRAASTEELSLAADSILQKAPKIVECLRNYQANNNAKLFQEDWLSEYQFRENREGYLFRHMPNKRGFKNQLLFLFYNDHSTNTNFDVYTGGEKVLEILESGFDS